MATNTQIPGADRRVPVIAPGHTFSTIGEKISNIVLSRPVSLGWIFGFLIVFSMMNMLMMALGYLFIKGTGIWGINIPIGWGFAIVNFVWWIGIGHAGTLISAILCLLRQTWRNSISWIGTSSEPVTGQTSQMTMTVNAANRLSSWYGSRWTGR